MIVNRLGHGLRDTFDLHQIGNRGSGLAAAGRSLRFDAPRIDFAFWILIGVRNARCSAALCDGHLWGQW